MRLLSLLLGALSAVVALQPAFGQDAYTTRIETRPAYGAVVTFEHGVRVYRPVPPTDHLIVNPGGQTPLVLGVDAQRVLNQSVQVITVGR
jgi:hypothetical protein